MRNLLITFEGIDGCGKSTQARLLRGRLEAAGIPVALFREPGGTLIGEKVRSILLDVSHAEMSHMTELLLYLAARAQLAEECIRPAFAEGKMVIMDRYYDSTTAYQGHARGLGIEMVSELNRIATDALVPDVTFVFDCAPSLAFSRLNSMHDRLESEGINFMERVREGFLKLHDKEPSRIIVLDGSLSIGTIEGIVYEEVLRRAR